MRELREHIRTEGYVPVKGQLTFSVKQEELSPAPGEKVTGTFEIAAQGNAAAEGFIRTDDERMQCLTPYFCGGQEQIEYSFDAGGMQEGETRSGRFFIVSNYGEYELPWKAAVREKPALSSLGEILDLFQFTNLARASWAEAVKLFYSDRFPGIIGGQDEELLQLYRGLSAHWGNEVNMEEFLIAIRKKQPISFSVNRKEITASGVEGQISEEVVLQKVGWGPVRIAVRTEGDFLAVEKAWILADDFLGNQYRLSVFLDEEKLHGGENLGRLTLEWCHGRVQIPVTARRRGGDPLPADRQRGERRAETVRLVTLYQDFRMKKIGMDAWKKEARACVDRLIRLSPEKSISPKLFHAQLLMTEDRADEAGWVLMRLHDRVKEAPPAVYCYYLYLTTLYNREESYVRKTTLKIEEIFSRNGQDWRIAWLILFVSRQLAQSASRKWAFLTAQFAAGCTSPVLYLEALQLLNANPVLLPAFDGMAKRLLLYGARKGILSRDLMSHVIRLAAKEKYYDAVLFDILRRYWEKTKDEEALQAICTLLIKGGRTGKDCYPWYLRGVEQKLRITRLYEHFMMSLDPEQEVEIPRSVLIYFAYQSNLDYEYAACLYAYVERHREEDPELYIAYRPQMERFVLDQLYRGRVNRYLAELYRALLPEALFTPQNAAALAPLLCYAQVTCPGDPKRLAVVFSRRSGEASVPLRQGRAYVELCGTGDMLFTEDEAQHRRPADARTKKEFLFGREGLFAAVAPYAADVLTYHLAVVQDTQIVVNGTNAESYLQIARASGVRKDWQGAVRMALVRYCFSEDRTEELDGVLRMLEPEALSPGERTEAVRYLVLEGFYDKAYQWLAGMDPGQQDARILLRLCSRLLEQGRAEQDARMTALCFQAALRGKYDGNMLRQLVGHYEGSIGEMEAIRTAADGFGLNTFPICERILEQMLFCGRDVTERTELLRQYAAEGGRHETRIAFLHRCAYSYVMEDQPIHGYAVQEMLRLIREKAPVTDLCRIACLSYYAANRDAVDAPIAGLIREIGTRMIRAGQLLPMLKEFSDLIPGAELLLDKTFVVYRGDPGRSAVLNYRILQKEDADAEYESMSLRHICSGIFAAAFILFPGETLQYYVSEPEDPSGILDGGLLKAEETPHAPDGRYGMLAAATAEHLADGQSRNTRRVNLEMLQKYLYTDFCAGRLFRAQV